MQELGKFDFKIKLTPNRWEKYMSFNTNNISTIIDSFQFLGFSLDSLVTNLGEDDFKNLSQEFDSKILEKLIS